MYFKAFEGSAEPSHSLCDKAVDSYSKNTLVRIEWKDEALKGHYLEGLLSARPKGHALYGPLMVFWFRTVPHARMNW